MVEIMRKERNVPFDVPADFTGPYPSADTCIMLDVAARLGRSCCMLGVTGDDTFADVVTNRLSRDGVDISHMTRLAGKGTIIVFVRYEADGTREYLECQNNAAATAFCAENIDSAVVSQARWVHFSGEVLCICADPQRREAMLKVLRSVSPDAKVSLDPNFVESDIADLQALVQPFIDRADLILPSEGEARQMMGTQTDEQACEMLAAKGKIVALKRGSRGCDIYEGTKVHHADAFMIQEVDPTGCEDSFCAGFLTGLLEGLSMQKVGELANAADALQATALGTDGRSKISLGGAGVYRDGCPERKLGKAGDRQNVTGCDFGNTRNLQTVRKYHCAEEHRPDRQARRDSCSLRRKRRGQVDADEHHQRGVSLREL